MSSSSKGVVIASGCKLQTFAFTDANIRPKGYAVDSGLPGCSSYGKQ